MCPANNAMDPTPCSIERRPTRVIANVRRAGDRFRNDIAHGVVNGNARSLEKTQRLRAQAKDISRELFEIAGAHGHKLKPSTDYYKAIGMRAEGRPPNNRLQPTAAGAMMTRRGLSPM